MEEGGEPSANEMEYRWGHSEGITAIDCVVGGDSDSEKFVTCGADSDLRIWKGFKDSDPEAHELTDNGLTLICGKKGEVYVGTEFNTVEALSLEDGKNLGVKAKFTAPVNHLDLSDDGKWLVAGSGDTKIQLIDLEDSSILPVPINTHSAPVLSVALDPKKAFLASSGCDGNVCIWSLTDEGKPVHLVKKFENIFPSSNDIKTSSILCRLAWEANGKILAVPEEEHVALYMRESWVKLKVLKGQKFRKITSVTKFSPCSTYIAAGGSDGSIIVWAVKDSQILAETAQFSDQITGIVFANNGADILAADSKGRILLLKDYKTHAERKTGPESSSKQQQSSKNGKDKTQDDSDDDMPSSPEDPPEPKDAFDDGMDDLFMDDADKDNEISISKLKAESGFVGDEYVGVDKARKVIVGGDLRDKKDNSDDENDDARSVTSSLGISRSTRRVVVEAPIKIPFTEPQKPFQPASSPAHLDHRFLIWNNTGIIRNYAHENDEKKAIDIDFHDAAVHHAVHLRNQHDYTIATLTREVAVFASEQQSDAGSKLFCYNFGAWDSKKEWMTDLPRGEEVVGIAAGDGWIAASTDMNRIRLFTVGGAQKQLIEIGGQIIATSGHEDLLFITYHYGIGLHDNQCIAYSIFRIKPSLKPFPLVSSEPLPISPKSQVSWAGFSDEGTPVCSDSQNVLRILCGRYWTTFCSMKEQLHTGSSDHFWVVGVSELDQRIRAVKCKGMKYPPTLPRPILMQVDAQMPFCEMETEKSRLEDRLHRSLMLDALAKKMDKKNFEVDDYKSKAEKDLKESLFNLFVMSCNGDWDARGTEYVSMMPSAHAVQVAVKYASKLRKRGLVDRLTALGRRKLDEEDLENEGDDDDFETLKMGTVIYSHVQNRSLIGDYSASQDLFPEASTRLNSSSASLSNSFSAGNRSVITVPDDENPFMKKNTDDIRRLLGSSDTPSNRFRKDKPQNSSTENGESSKGLSIIDTWKKPAEKAADLFTKTVTTRNSKGGGRKGAADKEKGKEQGANKEKKKQATLFQMGTKARHSSGGNTSNPPSPAITDLSEESNDILIENQRSDAQHEPVGRNSESLLEDSTNLRCQDQPEEPPQKGKHGYLLWFDENKEDLEKENPGMGLKELTKIGTQLYRKLSAEEKKRYTNPNTDSSKEDKKRKRSEVEGDEVEPVTANGTAEGEKKSKLTSKLAAFVCSNAD